MSLLLKPAISSHEQIQDKTEYTAVDGSTFQDKPFEGFLYSKNEDEEREVSICPRWRNGLTGRSLSIEVGRESIGNIIKATDQEGNLTPLGKRMVQWGEWFIDSTYTTSLENSETFNYENVKKWQTSMEEEILEMASTESIENPEYLFTLLRNLGYLTTFDIKNLTREQFKKLNEIDLNKSKLEDIWDIVEEQPGYWGSRTKEEVEKRNAKYGIGRDKWTVAFRPKELGILTTHQFANSIFTYTYRRFLETHPGILDYLTNSADLYESEKDKDLEFSMRYDVTAYYPGPTKYQFVILRRLMFLSGLTFEGKQPLIIRGMKKNSPKSDPVARILHPGALALPKELIENLPDESSNLSEQYCWWKGWEVDEDVYNSKNFPPDLFASKKSLERLYHQSKVILARKNPQLNLVDELISNQ